ncbi:GntR family transcriptional regulator [Nocardia sp. NPDC005978]|uniref:GntR family transcriptional regulator n=1 Tax=Nocardia sp. NPDC005978 TaxID=3156725 RepID=UPI0033A9A38C
MARRGRIPLSERVYLDLRRDLAGGVLVPNERLGEERLAETYGVSRTPVREALARLYADGLLERHADGLYPYRPRVEELGDLYELRIVLEVRGIQRLHSGAADTAAVKAELETWQRLRENPPEPGAELIAADERFHTALLAAAGNSALADMLETVHARVRPVRAIDMPTPERVATMTEEHIAIAEHVLSGDLDPALTALLAHLTSSRAHVLDRARRALELTKLAQAVRE